MTINASTASLMPLTASSSPAARAARRPVPRTPFPTMIAVWEESAAPNTVTSSQTMIMDGLHRKILGVAGGQSSADQAARLCVVTLL